MVRFLELEGMTTDQRKALAERLVRGSEDDQRFREEVIWEIERRLWHMTSENFVNAACDILRNSRLEPPAADVVEKGG